MTIRFLCKRCGRRGSSPASKKQVCAVPRPWHPCGTRNHSNDLSWCPRPSSFRSRLFGPSFRGYGTGLAGRAPSLSSLTYEWQVSSFGRSPASFLLRPFCFASSSTGAPYSGRKAWRPLAFVGKRSPLLSRQRVDPEPRSLSELPTRLESFM